MVKNQFPLEALLKISTPRAEMVTTNIKSMGITVNQAVIPLLINQTLMANKASAPKSWLAEPKSGHTVLQVPDKANPPAPSRIITVAR